MERKLTFGWVPAVCLAGSPLLAQVASNTNSPTPAPGDSPIELLQMMVTGTRAERLLSEVAIRTVLIPIQGEGVGAARKLAEALELTTGLRVESTCQNCNSSEVQMLGLPQRYSAILIDGMPTFSSLAGIYGLEHGGVRSIYRQ